jgi:hypothetical protein
MKTIKITFAAIFITISSFAQDSTNNNSEMTIPPTDNSIKGSDEDMKSNQINNGHNQNKNINNQSQGEYNKEKNQNTKTTNDQIVKDGKNNKDEKNNSKKDYLIMKNGKVIIVKNGNHSGMRQTTMTLNNGTKIMMDGTVIKNGGTKMKLKEGEAINMSGEMITVDDSDIKKESKKYGDEPVKSKSPMTEKDKMYLVPDSTIKK